MSQISNNHNLFRAHWNWLHTLAFYVQEVQPINNFDQLVTRSFHLLNCSECIQDAQIKYKKLLTQNLSTSQRILELHNSVNSKLGKPSRTLNQIKATYLPSNLAKLSKAYFDWIVPLYNQLLGTQIPIYQQLLIEFHQMVYQQHGPPPMLVDSRNPNRSIELKIYKYYQNLFRKLGYPVTNYSQLVVARTFRSASGGCTSCQKKRQRLLEAQNKAEATKITKSPQNPKAASTSNEKSTSITRSPQSTSTTRSPQTNPPIRSPQSTSTTRSQVSRASYTVTPINRTNQVSQATLNQTFRSMPLALSQQNNSKLPPPKPKISWSEQIKTRQEINEPPIIREIRYSPVPLGQRSLLKTPELRSLRRLAMTQSRINHPDRSPPTKKPRRIVTMPINSTGNVERSVSSPKSIYQLRSHQLLAMINKEKLIPT